MDNLSTKVKTTPLLSPVMESELLQETWPPVKDCLSKVITVSTSALWEENFQDLSDYCVDQKSGNWSRAQPPSQLQDYRIGEEITSKISSVGDNNDYLYNIKSSSEEITETGDNWMAGNNIKSAEMSFNGSLPFGQDQFDTVTDISDDWLSLLTTTSMNEQPTIDSLMLIPDNNRDVPGSNSDLICDNTKTWIQNTTVTNTIPLDNSLANNLLDGNCIEYQSSSTNSTDDKYEQRCPATEEHLLADILLPTDIETNSFDLLSYLEEENRNTLENSITEREESIPLEITVPSETANTDRSRPYRKRKSSQIETTKTVPPLKINIKTKLVSTKKRRSSKLMSEESTSFIDSDSDTRTSDYYYKELREKNNEASRKSRINKKVKETEMMKKQEELERENKTLKLKVEGLEKLVISMRKLVFQSASRNKF